MSKLFCYIQSNMVKKVAFAAIWLLQSPSFADAPAASPKVAETVSYAPIVKGPAMNEMRGTLLSVDPEAKVLRVTMEGGFNVEFVYNSKGVITNGGHAIAVTDLNYGDTVVIRYKGKDLTALEIERTAKGAISAAQVPAATETSESSASVPLENPSAQQ